jgi:chromate transport protein ChrA
MYASIVISELFCILAVKTKRRMLLLLLLMLFIGLFWNDELNYTAKFNRDKELFYLQHPELRVKK